ncbi:MAG: lytic transglycosylase domain-containing protein [Thermoanaerobaculia bacterium]|nr:lytic transglycosylase domain-containing protein [Thermoanaerobaculia bacterium]
MLSAGRLAFSSAAPDTPPALSEVSVLRKRLFAASLALAKGDGSAEALVAGLDASPLGLPGLPEWIGLSAGTDERANRVSALLAFAAGAPPLALSRAALSRAARLAATPKERAAVSAALAARPAPERSKPRALIARALAESRVASGAEARGFLVRLAAILPDAPARASDLFDDDDRDAFEAAVGLSSVEIRVARARAIAGRDSRRASALLRSLGPDVPARSRAETADAWLLAGSPRDAKRLLSLGLADPADETEALHRAALSWLVETRLMGVPETRRARRSRRAPAARPSRALSEKEKVAAGVRLAALDALLLGPLFDDDRRRLLESGVRLAWKAARADDARRLLTPLLALDSTTDAGAAEWFAVAWARYAVGDFAEAARLFDEQIPAYRGAFLRRRATYWSARAHEKAGDASTAKALYAGLVPGTVADLYGRWAAAALGVTIPAAPPALAAFERDEVPGEPALPSREFLRCGFPGLAEDAAESEGSLDPLFAGRAASARGDHRRAAAVLKRRYPELGTPEEGAVPAQARAAYYPLAHADRIGEAARAAGVPASLLFGLIRQESVFTEDAKSRAGALGLMQVMPSTGRHLYRKEKGKGRPDLRDPDANLRLGARYLRQLLDAFSGDTGAALAAYNAGPARVRAWKRASHFAPEDEFLESIPFSETRLYVKRVLFFQSVYSSLYGLPLDAASPVASLPAAEPKP